MALLIQSPTWWEMKSDFLVLRASLMPRHCKCEALRKMHSDNKPLWTVPRHIHKKNHIKSHSPPTNNSLHNDKKWILCLRYYLLLHSTQDYPLTFNLSPKSDVLQICWYISNKIKQNTDKIYFKKLKKNLTQTIIGPYVNTM